MASNSAAGRRATSVTFMILVAVLSCCQLPAQVVNAVDPPPGILSIHNDFASKLYVQCDSDKEHQAVDMVWPEEAHGFNFWPEAHLFWMCTVKTTPNLQDPFSPEYSGPVPALGGKFTFFASHPAFRACYPICVWKANADGLWLILKAGTAPTKVYNWTWRG